MLDTRENLKSFEEWICDDREDYKEFAEKGDEMSSQEFEEYINKMKEKE